REEAGKGARHAQRLRPAPFAVEPVKQVQERGDLAAQSLGLERSTLGQLREQADRALRLGGRLRCFIDGRRGCVGERRGWFSSARLVLAQGALQRPQNVAFLVFCVSDRSSGGRADLEDEAADCDSSGGRPLRAGLARLVARVWIRRTHWFTCSGRCPFF